MDLSLFFPTHNLCTRSIHKNSVLEDSKSSNTCSDWFLVCGKEARVSLSWHNQASSCAVLSLELGKDLMYQKHDSSCDMSCAAEFDWVAC